MSSAVHYQQIERSDHVICKAVADKRLITMEKL